MASRPLAVRMRPMRLEEIVGQAHIVGEGLLPRLIENDRFGSLIFHGPRGAEKLRWPRSSPPPPAVASSGLMRFSRMLRN